MNWFRNLKISIKLIWGFAVIIALTLFLAVFAVLTLISVDSSYTQVLDYPVLRAEHALKAYADSLNLRRAVVLMGLSAGDASKVEAAYKETQQAYSDLNANLSGYLNALMQDSSFTDSDKRQRREVVDSARKALEVFLNVTAKGVYTASLAEDWDAIRYLIDNGRGEAQSIMDSMTALVDRAMNRVNEISQKTTNEATVALYLQIGISIGILILAMIIALFIASVIKKPIVELAVAANEIAKGNMNINIRTDGKDEIGDLSRSFSDVVGNVKTIISDIEEMFKLHEKQGDMDARIDKNKFQGSYMEVAEGINGMVDSYVYMINEIFCVLEAIGDGDFNKSLSTYVGKKSNANLQINNLRQRIVDVSNEIQILSKAGAAGDLSKRADDEGFKGEWAGIVKGLNDLMVAVAKPIDESLGVIKGMSQGNFHLSVNGLYKGDFLVMKESLNGTIKAILSYIAEINNVLKDIASGDLKGGITRDYVGQFSSIKDSINIILESLNKTMTEINVSSDQVLAGAKQISESAMTLAEGATEQASSIQQLTASIDMINQQTRENAESSRAANDLSILATENAKTGNVEMKNMLGSMEAIKESSNNISKIIKVIDDISFQTNLLALNAAVEAARAGEHGKGFAVVAEEVRSLAGRSQKAAKETTELIESSIAKVDEGTITANATAESLHRIVENIQEVSNIISQISESSVTQSDAISQVSIGINQISQVVQSNSSTSEESASASEELNSQAEMLRHMVAFFKVK